MSSIREQITAAAFLALATDVPDGVPAPVRTRLESPKPEQLPALTMYQGREIVDPARDEKEDSTSRTVIVRRVLDLHIETIVKTVAGVAADQLADPMIVWATKSMIGGGRFGILANDPADEMGTVFEYEQADFSYCRARTTFRFHYQTRRDDAEAIT